MKTKKEPSMRVQKTGTFQLQKEDCALVLHADGTKDIYIPNGVDDDYTSPALTSLCRCTVAISSTRISKMCDKVIHKIDKGDVSDINLRRKSNKSTPVR